jgi:hypothetical protein
VICTIKHVYQIQIYGMLLFICSSAAFNHWKSSKTRRPQNPTIQTQRQRHQQSLSLFPSPPHANFVGLEAFVGLADLLGLCSSTIFGLSSLIGLCNFTSLADLPIFITLPARQD